MITNNDTKRRSRYPGKHKWAWNPRVDEALAIAYARLKFFPRHKAEVGG